MHKNRRPVHLKIGGWLSNTISRPLPPPFFSFFLDCGSSLLWSSVFLGSVTIPCVWAVEATVVSSTTGGRLREMFCFSWLWPKLIPLAWLDSLGIPTPWATCYWVEFMTQLAPGALLPYLWSGLCLRLCEAKLEQKWHPVGHFCTLRRTREIPSTRSHPQRPLHRSLCCCDVWEIQGFLGELSGSFQVCIYKHECRIINPIPLTSLLTWS